jgi:hypothetical protein
MTCVCWSGALSVPHVPARPGRGAEWLAAMSPARRAHTGIPSSEGAGGAAPRSPVPAGSIGDDGADEELGVLQFDVAGRWAVAEFAEWLRAIDAAYVRLGLLLSGEVDRVALEQATATIDEPLHAVFEPVVRLGLRLVPLEPLTVARLEMASPGFAEVIGNLNPLKVIADFITQWRRQNGENKGKALDLEKVRLQEETKRLRAELDSVTRLQQAQTQATAKLAEARVREQARLDRARTEGGVSLAKARIQQETKERAGQVSLVNAMLKQRVGHLVETGPPLAVGRYLDYILDQPLNDIERMARDVRVQQVALFSSTGLVSGTASTEVQRRRAQTVPDAKPVSRRARATAQQVARRTDMFDDSERAEEGEDDQEETMTDRVG